MTGIALFLFFGEIGTR